jgi:glycosyltransferase involved in cell wall biosynthesis
VSGVRVLHIESSKNWGGQEFGILEQIRWLLTHGHEAALAAPEDSEILARARAWDLPAHPVDFRGSYSPRAIAGVRRLVHTGRFDVIDAHGSHAAASAGCAVNLCGVVRSLHVYTEQKGSLSRRLMWRWGCHHAIVRADCIKRQLVALGFKKPEQVSVVGSWAAPEFFEDATVQERTAVRAEFGLAPESVLFAVIGMLRPDKGQIHFIRAAAHYVNANRDAYFLIVGSPTRQHKAYEELLRATVSQMGLEHRVILTGYRNDAARIMRAADAVAVTSTGVEAQPRMVSQAFAARVPIVATRVGGVDELVVPKETGWLVEPGDELGTAEALKGIVSDRRETARIVGNARRLAERHLTLDSRMRETLVAYDHARHRRAEKVVATA